ncbi:MAG: hypothetical protein K0R43_3419 [Pseudoduganella sp.]|jgi:hypothetical protein|nr:hypothetical protein [Pseudoduganella sp.]
MEEHFTRHQYLLNYFDSLKILETKRNQLERTAGSPKLNDQQRAEAAAAFLDIVDQIAHFNNAHEAMMRKFTGIGAEPPGQEVVAKTQKLETSLAELIAKAQTHQALLKAVTDFVNRWTKLSSAEENGNGAAPKASAPATHLSFLGQ